MQKPSRPSSCTTKNLDEVDQDILGDMLTKPDPPGALLEPKKASRSTNGLGATSMIHLLHT